jgi:TatD DNase family protein
MLVDSHCHLDFPEFAPELPAVVARAQAVGVGACVTIGTKLSGAARVREVAEEFPSVFCSVGVHPHEAAAEPLENDAPLIALASHRKAVGIGETGLDYYYEHSPREAQVANFRTHIGAARETELPLIIHTRDAEDDTIAILREEMKKGPFSGVVHCFTGSDRLARAALELGLYISASGILTFKKADALREVLRDVPLDRLLVETDAPYLAPVPHRGKRNEPAFVSHTAKALAELKAIPSEALAAATTDNFFRLFSRVPRFQEA